MQKNAQKKPNVLIKNKTFIISASAKYKKIEQNKVIMDKKINLMSVAPSTTIIKITLSHHYIYLLTQIFKHTADQL